MEKSFKIVKRKTDSANALIKCANTFVQIRCKIKVQKNGKRLKEETT